MRRWLVCRGCGSDLDLGPYFAGCPRCGGALEVTYDYAALDSTTVADTRLVVVFVQARAPHELEEIAVVGEE